MPRQEAIFFAEPILTITAMLAGLTSLWTKPAVCMRASSRTSSPPKNRPTASFSIGVSLKCWQAKERHWQDWL